MNRKKARLNFLIIFIVILLIISVLLMRFEVNPFSYFLEKEEETKEETVVKSLNGVYINKETTTKAFSFFSGCTVSYFNNTLVIIEDEFHIYRESCVGTFYVKSGKVSELKLSESLEKNQVVTFDGVDYYKNEYIDSIKINNAVNQNNRAISGVTPENYRELFKEATKDGKTMDLRSISFKMSPGVFYFNLSNSGNSIDFKIFYSSETILYEFNTDDFSKLPELKAIGENMVIIEPEKDANAYRYKFKVLSSTGFTYDLSTKFPIKVDTVQLTTANSIFVKFNPTKNNFIMLVGNDKQLCAVDDDSNDIAYYVFDINYNYATKKFEKPEFIKIVYKRDGCKHANEVMGW